eukprot:TRINITY_DN116307_c0_g1_i1.p1 TRINITY_DN116307_c0_g1~~TRINITY_DN116307_c0_g1_i1.p1  ORF type:complete len:104 (-),score=6.53 TRINITY_DN116307_c0_g1_i1:216-527(-)
MHKVDPHSSISISITFAENPLSNLRELIQTSARASADLAPKYLLFLFLEALLLHQVVDLLQLKPAKIYSLHLLAMLVKENQVRVVSWNEVHLQSSISVSAIIS